MDNVSQSRSTNEICPIKSLTETGKTGNRVGCEFLINKTNPISGTSVKALGTEKQADYAGSALFRKETDDLATGPNIKIMETEEQIRKHDPTNETTMVLGNDQSLTSYPDFKLVAPYAPTSSHAMGMQAANRNGEEKKIKKAERLFHSYKAIQKNRPKIITKRERLLNEAREERNVKLTAEASRSQE